MQQQPPRVRRFPLGGDLYAYVSPSEHKVELRIGRIQMATDRKGGWTEMEGSDVRLDLKKWRRLVAMERKLTEEFERHQVAWQNFQRGRKRASLQERRNQDKKKSCDWRTTTTAAAWCYNNKNKPTTTTRGPS